MLAEIFHVLFGCVVVDLRILGLCLWLTLITVYFYHDLSLSRYISIIFMVVSTHDVNILWLW